MSPPGRSVNAVRRLARSPAHRGGRHQRIELVGELAGSEQDLTLAEDSDVARDESDHGRLQHVTRDHEVDGTFLEAQVAQGEVQRSGDGAEYGELVDGRRGSRRDPVR